MSKSSLKKAKNNWKNFHPPMMPIYYVELKELVKMFNKYSGKLDMLSLHLMLGYFEESEKYEHASVVQEEIEKTGTGESFEIGDEMDEDFDEDDDLMNFDDWGI